MNSAIKNPSKARVDNPYETGLDRGTSALLEKIANERSELPERSTEHPQPERQEYTLFNRVRHTESEIPQQIDALLSQLQQEMELLKKASAALAAKTNAVEKEVIQAAQMDPSADRGIHHVFALENMLKFLKETTKEISNATLWLEASVSRKKQRGYKALRASKGTSFSLSQELHGRPGM